MEERQYDLIFICRPDTPEADVDKVIATLEHAASEKGGKVESVNKWGRRRMAYRVQKLREGYYVYLVVKSTHGEVVKELERRLKVSEPVIKYLTVRLDDGFTAGYQRIKDDFNLTIEKLQETIAGIAGWTREKKFRKALSKSCGEAASCSVR